MAHRLSSANEEPSYELPWPIAHGKTFVDLVDDVLNDGEKLKTVSMEMLIKCGLLKAEGVVVDEVLDSFKKLAMTADLGVYSGSAPILAFDARRAQHWKFTPQCEIFPVAKSICLTKFREDFGETKP